MINKIRHLLAANRFCIHNEKELQDGIQKILDKENIPYKREYFLSRKDKPDFFFEIDGTVLEVKYHAKEMPTLRQLKRYSEHQSVKEIILVSTRRMNIPDTLSGKNCYCITIFNL